jgi:peroxiredoxin
MALNPTFPSSVGNYAPDFEIPGVDREVYHLSKYLHSHKLVCVVFLSNCCPIVRSQLPKLQELQTRFSELSDLMVVGINSNDSRQEPEESFEKMQTFAQQMRLNFPYLWDSTQDVALGFQAQVSSEVFVVNQQGLVLYGGNIEDLKDDLITTMLSTEDFVPVSTEPIGNPIKWRS